LHQQSKTNVAKNNIDRIVLPLHIDSALEMDAVEKKTITPEQDSLSTYLSKIWDHRSMIILLASREIKGKFTNTKTGLLSVFFQPVIYVVVYTIFFQQLIKLEVESPYPLFAFTGVIGWLLFSNLVTSIGTSVSDSQNLITKVYFPKLILPLSKILVGLFEFVISLVIMLLLMVVLSHFEFSVNTLLFPILILMNVMIAMSIGIWFSALSFRHKDLNHIVPHIVGFGIWLTPVFYPSTLIPDDFLFVIYLNPVAAVIESYRWLLLGQSAPSAYYLISFISVFILLISGLFYFRKVEDKIVDYV